MFTVPPEQMDLTPEHQHIITESAIFSHRPEIGRVIFISAPLRGADKAGGWLGRPGTRLIKLPADVLTPGREEAVHEKVAAGHKHPDRFPDSVDTLSPDNDFVKALAGVPLVPGIPYHTIAGDRGRGDAPDSSDGLRPYWSSHLPGATSEKSSPPIATRSSIRPPLKRCAASSNCTPKPDKCLQPPVDAGLEEIVDHLDMAAALPSKPGVTLAVSGCPPG